MTYQLTKVDIAALRQADSIVVHYNAAQPSLTGMAACKRLTDAERAKDPYANDKRYQVFGGESAPITVNGYSFHGSLSRYLTGDDRKSVKAFALISLYRRQNTEEDTIIDLLRAGDEIRLEFMADAYTTEAMRDRCTFHGDELRLYVTRGKKQMAFLLRYEICEDNSARMIRGLPRKPIAQAA